MKLRFLLKLSSILFVLVAFSACQNSGPFSLFKPSETPVPPTLTATLLPPTPTETSTPTITPTPTATFTPTPAMVAIPAGSVTAPILLYHHIAPNMPDSQYNVDPAKFDEQMKWLFDNGYQTINVRDVDKLLRNGGKIPLRPVVITFDDGNLDIYSNAYPILKKYNFVATFFVVDTYINGQDMISTDQLKELMENGWEIGSHSMTHVYLTDPNANLDLEIRQSKADLKKKLGVPITTFAFPFGAINEEVLRLTVNYGYSAAVGLNNSYTHQMNTIYYLSRIEIKNDCTLDQFISFLPWSGPIQ